MEVNSSEVKLSPVQQNSALREFYEHANTLTFPNILGDVDPDVKEFSEEVKKEIAKRENNPVTINFSEKLKTFLSPLKSTQSMKDYILKDFIKGRVYGEKFEMPKWVDEEGGAGAYDENNLMRTERNIRAELQERIDRSERNKRFPLGSQILSDREFGREELVRFDKEFEVRYGQKI
jgi:hypothetical protein